MKKYGSYLLILLAGSIWGTIGLFNRTLNAAGFAPRDIVMLRNLGSLVLLTVIFLLADRSVFRIRLRHLPYFFGTGIISVLLFTLLYFSCQQRCSLAMAAILLYTAPIFVVLLSVLLWREPITKRKLLALGVAFLGCSFASGVWSGGLAITPVSLLMGLGSGLFYAAYTIFSRYALAYYKPMTVVYYTFVFAGLGSVFLSDPVQAVSAISADGRLLAVTVGLVAFSSVLPYFLYTRGLVDVEGGKASILASIEPVVASVAGVIAFGEPLSLWVVLGLVCILTAIYLLK